MTLHIETFSNTAGGNSFFKAIGHPAVASKVGALVARLASGGEVACYDPMGSLAPFAEFFDLSNVAISAVFVQDVTIIGQRVLGQTALPVTAMATSTARTVFLPAFDTGRMVQHIRHLLPPEASLITLDELRLPSHMQSDRNRYLAPLNFATNFAFFRDEGGHHTRLITANYWSAYGATDPRLWLCLFDATGKTLVEWTEGLPPSGGTITIDSAKVRARFGLPEFTGQLFVHVLGAAGHDVVKYALDTYDDSGRSLSCTHDANAWPAELYAGLPAPRPGSQVLLWVQNSHPCPIPEGSVTLGVMGTRSSSALGKAVPAFGSVAVDVAALLPHAHWPQQIEIQAGKHFVRPRYEVVEGRGNGRRHIAHVNVERTDLVPDPRLKELGNLLGKGHILPAPVLPTDNFRTLVLPTPMSTAQIDLPLALLVFDATGALVLRHRLGILARDHSTSVDVSELLAKAGRHLPSGFGHLELVYDLAEGGVVDGWMHALFRYEHRTSGHAAETSFGSHLFNMALTYQSEPQSYAGPPPGLTSRLFLRVGLHPYDTLCQLIYPASTPWHEQSDTHLILTDGEGQAVAESRLHIPCSGSQAFTVKGVFTERERAAAGPAPSVLIRDATCRLFGYHGLLGSGHRFSLDHMFGF